MSVWVKKWGFHMLVTISEMLQKKLQNKKEHELQASKHKLLLLVLPVDYLYSLSRAAACVHFRFGCSIGVHCNAYDNITFFSVIFHCEFEKRVQHMKNIN